MLINNKAVVYLFHICSIRNPERICASWVFITSKSMVITVWIFSTWICRSFTSSSNSLEPCSNLSSLFKSASRHHLVEVHASSFVSSHSHWSSDSRWHSPLLFWTRGWCRNSFLRTWADGATPVSNQFTWLNVAWKCYNIGIAFLKLWLWCQISRSSLITKHDAVIEVPQ